MKKKSSTSADFLQSVSAALVEFKRELQENYERAYPALREIIHLVLDEEEAKAWNLSTIPHLIFPDLVEAHIARLNLQPVASSHEEARESREMPEFPMLQPAFA